MLYLQFNALHFILPHGIINDSLAEKLLTKDQYRENLRVSERAWIFFCIHKYPITPISFNVWVGTYEWYDMFLGYFVTSVHSMQFPFYMLLMTWHYERLTSHRQNIHVEIICERAERAKKKWISQLQIYYVNQCKCPLGANILQFLDEIVK